MQALSTFPDNYTFGFKFKKSIENGSLKSFHTEKSHSKKYEKNVTLKKL